MIRYCINMNKTKDNNKTKDMNKNKNITNRSKSSFTVISNKNINNNNLTINNQINNISCRNMVNIIRKIIIKWMAKIMLNPININKYSMSLIL